MHLTLRQLKIFEAVARHLSFSRAADELHLTQPAVSMQVRSLEEAAGLPLTEQVGKRIFLTEAGAELARHARVIAQQLREAEESLMAMKGLRGGRLNIGVVSTAKYFVPRLLTAFRHLHPEVELRLGVHNRGEIVQQLADNEIDLAIMGRPPQELETVSEPFAENPLVFVAAPDHPLAKAKSIAPKQLAGESFLLREPGSGTRAAMERFLAENGVLPQRAVEMTSNETIKQAVMAGMGISFISERTIALELATGHIVRLSVAGTPLQRHWFVVHRAEKRLLPVAEAFRQFLLRESGGPIEPARAAASASSGSSRASRKTAAGRRPR
ncbi:MAG: LysR family transcriptional regulator [Rhodocyclaceae bacterium]|jgi:DNA-binding transcriptional LysR family regulator|nr:LysR family transcriptional regulator [Rhodocyclaceae bacterium]